MWLLSQRSKGQKDRLGKAELSVCRPHGCKCGQPIRCSIRTEVEMWEGAARLSLPIFLSLLLKTRGNSLEKERATLMDDFSSFWLASLFPDRHLPQGVYRANGFLWIGAEVPGRARIPRVQPQALLPSSRSHFLIAKAILGRKKLSTSINESDDYLNGNKKNARDFFFHIFTPYLILSFLQVYLFILKILKKNNKFWSYLHSWWTPSRFTSYFFLLTQISFLFYFLTFGCSVVNLPVIALLKKTDFLLVDTSCW